MKGAVLAILVVAAAAYPTFDAWASQNNKVYTAAEKYRRAGIFHQNMARLAELRTDNPLATFGATQFADLTYDEFSALYLGARRPDHVDVLPRQQVSGNAPDSFDWRDVTPKRVSPVQNQGSCGSCWAFGSVVYLEGSNSKAHALQKMSEQQLVDCDHECQDPDDKSSCDNGCNGGWTTTAMTYAIKMGMMNASVYPYKGRAGTCAYAKAKVIAEFTGKAVQLAQGDEAGLLERAASDGPITVAVNANIAWQLYMGGVLSGSCSHTTLNHGVAVVGWGNDDVDFWTIRNSWGASWGEKGYIRILRGKNHCGVAEAAAVIDA